MGVSKMKRLRYTIVMLISVFMMSQFFIQPAAADQTSDTFDITVTGEYIWIDITNVTWAIGTVSMSTSHWTNDTGGSNKAFIADKDNCTVACDLKLQITSDGVVWSAATDGNDPDVDTYRLNATINTTDDPPAWETQYQIVTASPTTINTSIPADENETFDLRYDVPTSTSTGDQQSMTVTATLVKS